MLAPYVERTGETRRGPVLSAQQIASGDSQRPTRSCGVTGHDLTRAKPLQTLRPLQGMAHRLRSRQPNERLPAAAAGALP